MSMISVIIPTYNERGNIGRLAMAISALLKGRKHEIVVVDDSSPDGTLQLLKALSRKIPLVPISRMGKRDLSILEEQKGLTPKVWTNYSLRNPITLFILMKAPLRRRS